MFATNQELEKINAYFKDFVIENRYCYSFDTVLEENIKKIIDKTQPTFHKSWDELTTLMLIIEEVYNVKSIITEKNYYRFEFQNNKRIQDKGSTKIDALFSCCYRTLEKYWKTEAPYFNRGVEPFDLDD